MSLLWIVKYFFLAFSLHHACVQSLLAYTYGYRSSFKTHLAGTGNLIISAPHGGIVAPVDVPDRSIGGCRRPTVCTWWFNDTCVDGQRCDAETVRDTRSDEFAENVANELNATWGFKPYVVIGAWSRMKVDFNREINEATLNHPEAILAYEGYHSSIVQALNLLNQTFTNGLLIDIHGHAQGNYTMMGYLLTGNQLNQLNLTALSVTTSIERLCGTNRENCIRGPNSFGTYLENNGLGIAYPSSANPYPGTNAFFSGGYITQNYISRINAIQTELPTGIRTSSNRLNNAKNYAKAVVEYMQAINLLQTV